MVEKNPGKSQLGERLNEGAVRTVIASNGIPFLQMRSVGFHNTSGRKDGKDEVMMELLQGNTFLINY